MDAKKRECYFISDHSCCKAVTFLVIVSLASLFAIGANFYILNEILCKINNVSLIHLPSMPPVGNNSPGFSL